MQKIFCIGFPKTGTTSLEFALGTLGYNVCKGDFQNNHTNYLISLFINKDFEEINRIINYYDAFADLPWGGTDFYVYLSKQYPEAKFIHTQREAEEWYVSLIKMTTKFDKNLEVAMSDFHSRGRYGFIYYLRKVIGLNSLDNSKVKLIKYFLDTNKSIENYFSSSNYSYLSLNIIEGDGWEKLCKFLNKEVPNIPFPHKNISIGPKLTKNTLKNIFKKKS